jgi:hypothetical protein
LLCAKIFKQLAKADLKLSKSLFPFSAKPRAHSNSFLPLRSLCKQKSENDSASKSIADPFFSTRSARLRGKKQAKLTADEQACVEFNIEMLLENNDSHEADSSYEFLAS